MFPPHDQNENQREREEWARKSSAALILSFYLPPTRRGCKEPVHRSLAEAVALSVETPGEHKKLVFPIKMKREYESLEMAQMFDYDHVTP